MIVWMEKALALAIHERQLAEHGGTAGVRDEGLLASALARPHQLHADGDPEPDLCDLAAALAYGLARNHPFLDGNKRTAHVAYRTFLELNGVELAATDEEKYLTMLALAEGKLSEEDFAAWLRERERARTKGEAHQTRAGYRAKPRSARSPGRRKRRRAGLTDDQAIELALRKDDDRIRAYAQVKIAGRVMRKRRTLLSKLAKR
jgi:death-on-curing protein